MALPRARAAPARDLPRLGSVRPDRDAALLEPSDGALLAVRRAALGAAVQVGARRLGGAEAVGRRLRDLPAGAAAAARPPAGAARGRGVLVLLDKHPVADARTLPAVAALLPWMLWLAERCSSAGGGRCAWPRRASTASHSAAAIPGTQVHVLVAAGVYALLRAAAAGANARRASALRPLALTLGGLVARDRPDRGAADPGDALQPRDRRHARAQARAGHARPARRCRWDDPHVLFPDWWGRRAVRDSSTADSINFNERTFYAGVVTLLIAASGSSRASAGGARRRSSCWRARARVPCTRRGCSGSSRICRCSTWCRTSACTSCVRARGRRAGGVRAAGGARTAATAAAADRADRRVRGRADRACRRACRRSGRRATRRDTSPPAGTSRAVAMLALTSVGLVRALRSRA